MRCKLDVICKVRCIVFVQQMIVFFPPEKKKNENGPSALLPCWYRHHLQVSMGGDRTMLKAAFYFYIAQIWLKT